MKKLLITICLFSLLFLGGCHHPIERKSPAELKAQGEWLRLMVFAYYVKEHFQTEMTVAEIAAEIEMQIYLKGLKNK